MKKEDSGTGICARIIFFCFFLGLAVFFFFGELLLPPTKLPDRDFCEVMHSEWYLVSDSEERTPLKIPGKCQAERGERVTIETTLPGDTAGTAVCLRSLRQDVEVYIDGALRAQYDTEKNRLFGKSSAAVYVFVELLPSDAGRKLTVATRTDSPYSGVFQEIYYGTKMGIWRDRFQSYGAELMIAVLMLILALTSIVVSIVLRFCYHKWVVLGDLGFGVVCAALWIICNSSLRQLIFPELDIISDIPFFILMLIPIPFLLYIDGIQTGRYHRGYQVFEFLAIADTVVCTLLQIFDIADFADTITYISTICLMSVCWIIITLFIDILHRRIKEYWLIAVGMFVTLILGCAQIFLYFQRTQAFNGNYIAIGLVFLLASAAISTGQDVVRMGKERQEAIYASRSKEQFLANISHEIRTPINAVLGLDEMILYETDQETVRDYAGDIQRAGRSLLALINDILDFSKMESGKMQITPVEYSVFSMLSDCYHMIFMRASEKGIDLQFKNNGDIPAKLLGDEIRIRQILINLLTNAVKYTQEGSVTLSVEGEYTGEQDFLLICTVSDTGIGIKQENMDTLFESFERVDENRNRNIEGTGLGLAITQELAQLMDGSVTVESEYGRGSSFRVEIPQVIVDGTAMGELSVWYMKHYREDTKNKRVLKSCHGKILVVDDVLMNLKVFQGLLKDSGLEIHTAGSGEECLKMVSEESYHMIFLDHMMPGMNGVETLHAMKNLPTDKNRDTPVIMLTANALLGAKEEYLSEGFEDYLAKPVRKIDLEHMLQKYLPVECFRDQGKTEKMNQRMSGMDREEQFKDRFSFLDTETGMRYCADSIDIYRGTLEAFADDDRTGQIEKCFVREDWKNYQLIVHGLKGESLTVGAVRMQEACETIEHAAEEKDFSYIYSHHGELIKIYKELLLRIKLALEY